MTSIVREFERIVVGIAWTGVGIAALMVAAVLVQRVVIAVRDARIRHVARVYGPLIEPALAGDEPAVRAMVNSPRRYRMMISRLLLTPLVADRSPERIAATRRVLQAMSLGPLANRYLASRLWWRRTMALLYLGLVQDQESTARVIAALDDPNAAVRNAALDALADLQNPVALSAIVGRLNDAALERARRLAALAAYGSQSEALLLELADSDRAHRLNYARALATCGTARSRSTLCDWTADPRIDVRIAALQALGRVGLDGRSAAVAISALESPDDPVRAMAAAALHGWTGSPDATVQLARRLEDSWPVAVRAARALQSMDGAGRGELEALAVRQTLGGALARQMLWESEAQP
jgi:HEAT repeat protein